MARHIDSISDALLKEINEDLHDLNQSVNTMSKSVETLQADTAKIFKDRLDDLDDHFNALLSKSKADIEEETGRYKELLQESIRKISSAVPESIKIDSGTKSKTNKIIIFLLIFLILSCSGLAFVLGRGYEQTRYDQVLKAMQYIDINQ